MAAEKVCYEISLIELFDSNDLSGNSYFRVKERRQSSNMSYFSLESVQMKAYCGTRHVLKT